jgi:hypothetical protein
VLVGTLLGDAVSVEVHGSDVVAGIATVVLGAAAVGDVVFLNLRERAPEFATLVATGWDDAVLAVSSSTKGSGSAPSARSQGPRSASPARRSSPARFRSASSSWRPRRRWPAQP